MLHHLFHKMISKPSRCERFLKSFTSLFLIVFFLLTQDLTAQNTNLRFRLYDFNDGLTHRNVFKIQQDQAGFIWIATINGLKFDVHNEEKAVELFAENVLKAGLHFLENPMETPFIPSWNRVQSAIPDIFRHLCYAVDDDYREFS